MYRYKKRMWLSALLCAALCVGTVQAQEVEGQIADRYKAHWFNRPLEVTYLNPARCIHFAGEKLQFSLIVFNHFLQPSAALSKIVYVSLVAEDGTFYSYAFRNENGMINDAIELAEEMPTGNYQLIAHTRYMKNFDLDYYADRVSVYIQNPREDARQVVKKINGTNEFGTVIELPEKSNRFELSRMGSRLLIRINNFDGILGGKYYLISEGFQSVQFITQVNVKKESTDMVIPVNALVGEFQKFILVDGDLNVVGAHAYHLGAARPGDVKINLSEEMPANNQAEVQLQLNDNMVTLVQGKKNVLQEDSITLFRRVYRHFYNIPNRIDLSGYSYSQLVSSGLLARHSGFVADKWREILSTEEYGTMQFSPEQELSLYGKVTGPNPLPETARIDVHMFQNNVNTFSDINSDGTFRIGMFSWTKTDVVYAAVLTEEERDLSPDYNIEIFSEKIPYRSNVDYYDRSATDTLINKMRQLHFALSTMEDFPPPPKFLWEKKIYDEVVKVADYQSLETVEEFIREALPKLSIKTENGRRSFRLFDELHERRYEHQPFMMIDNSIIDDPQEILNFYLLDIDEFRMIYHPNRLENFGSPFVNGVFIVKTRTGEYQSPGAARNTRLVPYHGFQRKSKEDRKYNFSKTLFSELTNKPTQNIIFQSGKELGEFTISTETLTKGGQYQYTGKQLNVTYD